MYFLAAVFVTSHQVIWFGPRWRLPCGLAWFTTTLLMEHSSREKGKSARVHVQFFDDSPTRAGLVKAIKAIYR